VRVAISISCKLRVVSLILFIIAITACTSTLFQKTRSDTAVTPQHAPAESREHLLANPVGSLSEAVHEDSSVCLDCHQYGKNHHPVDFAPANTSNFHFPLYDGKVKCLTCHIEDHMGSDRLLRGGPYANRQEICFKCHYEEDYAQIFPHDMLQKDGRYKEVNGKPVCLICHARTPDPRVDRTKDVAFRADVAFLCWRCHSLMPQPTLNTHVLMKPSENMLKDIEQNEREMKVTIPLVPRNRITCSTCHNPHEKGVIIYELSAKGADSEDRLRLQSPDLCLICHKM
jgi:hypothetical protein